MRFRYAFDLRDWRIGLFWHSRTRRLYFNPIWFIRLSIQFQTHRQDDAIDRLLSVHDFAYIPGEEFDL